MRKLFALLEKAKTMYHVPGYVDTGVRGGSYLHGMQDRCNHPAVVDSKCLGRAQRDSSSKGKPFHFNQYADDKWKRRSLK